tara:strand:- start:2049 stop:3260 length:1212 start_codon:yes stop_codon:yes gene_type:complete
MSKYYAKSNDESTRNLFMKRIIYRTEPKLQRRPVVNFTQGGEKFLYGRVSPTMLPMMLPPDAPITKINSANCNDAKQPQQALNFVTDAFNDMCSLFDKKCAGGFINATHPYLSNLKAYKSYENPDRLYTKYRKVFQEATVGVLQEEQPSWYTFDQFMTRVVDVIQQGALSFPFTQPAYIKSKLCPMRCSGLVIELADLDYDNDEAKKRFIESPNWEFFVEACNQHGFMIDLNVPWRIVADIDSLGMGGYAATYHRPNLGSILSLYINVHQSYLPIFVESVVGLYNTSRKPRYDVHACDAGAPRLQVARPPAYTPNELLKDLGLEYFLDYYFQLRLAEEESQFTPAQQQRIIAETLQLYRQGNPERAVNIFEQILNKTFDYNGSLSYIMKSKKKKDDDDFSTYR